MGKIINDVNKIWNSLGSFWKNFEDKELIEILWQAYRDVITEKYQTIYQINLSKAFQYMPPYYEEKQHFFDVIYNASDEICSGLINTVIISGLHNYYIENDIFSIPSGLNNYYFQDINNEWILEHLTENTDFTIADYNRLIFQNNPPFSKNENYPNVSKGILSAPLIYKINPILFTLFGYLINITKEHFKNRDYHAFKTEANTFEQQKTDLKHFKYLIWAIHHLKRQLPTITNFKKLYGIAKGLPFAYKSGIVTENTFGNTTEGTNSQHITSSGHIACKFYTDKKISITKIKAYIKENSAPPVTAHCAVYDDIIVSGLQTKPNNKIADANYTVNISGLDWYEFDFNDTELEANNYYWLTIAAINDSWHFYYIPGDEYQSCYNWGYPPPDPFGNPTTWQTSKYCIYANYFIIPSGQDTYCININNESYYIPTSLNSAVNGGDTVNQFDLLVSGIEVRDYITHPDEMEALAEKDWQAHAILEFVTDPSLNILDYNSIFISGLMQDVIPKYLTVYYN